MCGVMGTACSILIWITYDQSNLEDQSKISNEQQNKTRLSVEHCTPHADGAWLNELGWSQ